MMQGWIPAFAESTPRLEPKGSGEGRTNQLSLLCIDDVLRGDIDVKAHGA